MSVEGANICDGLTTGMVGTQAGNPDYQLSISDTNKSAFNAALGEIMAQSPNGLTIGGVLKHQIKDGADALQAAQYAYTLTRFAPEVPNA